MKRLSMHTVEPPSLVDLLRNARASAIHLEMRDQYAVDSEDTEYRAWRPATAMIQQIRPPGGDPG